MLLAAIGIILAFPLGVLLALGRRSTLPALRIMSTAYIELIRGVPLVTILFMADILLPFFLPGEVRIDRVTRAMGGITLFSAAYVAENVRGGLQAIPTGQIEAAQALGLSTARTNIHIVLPQALRSVIPANWRATCTSSCRAVSSSGSRSPERWPCSPRSCCSTSRPRRSTRR